MAKTSAIQKNLKRIKLAKKYANKRSRSLMPATLEYAKYVIIFTNFPENSFSDFEVLDWYRCRWQVELTFKDLNLLHNLVIFRNTATIVPKPGFTANYL